MELNFDFLGSHHDFADFDCGNDALNEYLRSVAGPWRDPDALTVLVGLDGIRVVAYAAVTDLMVAVGDEGRHRRALFMAAVAVDKHYLGSLAFFYLCSEIKDLAEARNKKGKHYEGLAATTIYDNPQIEGFLERLGFNSLADNSLLWYRGLHSEAIVVPEESRPPRRKPKESLLPRRKPKSSPPPSWTPKNLPPGRKLISNQEIFICHASEDKETVARPLTSGLQARGYKVWLDESELQVGDSLLEGINAGLQRCSHGIVILSKAFFGKRWPEYELNALFTRSIAGDKHLILPVWHGVTDWEVREYSLALADRVATNTLRGIPTVVEDIVRAL